MATCVRFELKRLTGFTCYPLLSRGDEKERRKRGEKKGFLEVTQSGFLVLGIKLFFILIFTFFYISGGNVGRLKDYRKGGEGRRRDGKEMRKKL